MSGAPIDSFEAWVKFIFDRPEMTDSFNCWYDVLPDEEEKELQRQDEELRRNQDRLMEYMTRTLREAGNILPRYTERQALTGLRFIFHSCDFFKELLQATDIFGKKRHLLPWERRRELIRATYCPFADYYIKPERCHVDYYFVFENWWDNFPLPIPFFRQAHPEIPLPEESQAYYDEVLGVMEKILQLNDRACYNSVFFKLGRWREGMGKAERLIAQYGDKFKRRKES